ncbi:IPExxxVDY family protein [uncultured Capnocytophaga sp.]|jgi:hypothetical protein|uniref:IPExxxVDY family protein n=1 Tax=uncultured Capnocytophaga sp. TaxID=159273 RepID=UPI002592FDDD|nr:IPExxxVDY family protein [uncultured Capnocytophaga sp.]
MALLKLNKNELINYQLIGIETSLPDYKLAYKLNQKLHIQLAKHKDYEPLIATNHQYHSYYTWQDPATDLKWHCISNKMLIEGTPNQLFGIEYLIDKYKTIDYFLKIDTLDTDLCNANTIMQQLMPLKCKIIDPNKLNLKHNYIFQEC